jgi:hypothetical protein
MNCRLSGRDPEIPTPKFHRRPKGVWTFATFGNEATGKMAAPQGCKVVKSGQTLQLISSESGTLLLLK